MSVTVQGSECCYYKTLTGSYVMTPFYMTLGDLDGYSLTANLSKFYISKTIGCILGYYEIIR